MVREALCEATYFHAFFLWLSMFLCQIIAAHLGVINTSIKSLPEKKVVPQKLKPTFLPHDVRDIPISTQNSDKDSKRHTITLQNEEQAPKKPQDAVLELSKDSASYPKSGSRKKQCQICHESGIQKQASPKESKRSYEKSRISSRVGLHNQQYKQHNRSKQERGLVELKEKALKLVKGRDKPR